MGFKQNLVANPDFDLKANTNPGQDAIVKFEYRRLANDEIEKVSVPYLQRKYQVTYDEAVKIDKRIQEMLDDNPDDDLLPTG